MKQITVKFSGKTISIPTSANEWELYSSMKGAGLAASRLTRALEKALNASSREQAIKIMSEALSKNSKYGASDSEPRNNAEHYLSKGRGGNFAWVL